MIIKGMNEGHTDPLRCFPPPLGPLDVPTSVAGTRPDCRAAATPPCRHGNTGSPTFDLWSETTWEDREATTFQLAVLFVVLQLNYSSQNALGDA